jgi:hypothetical protein
MRQIDFVMALPQAPIEMDMYMDLPKGIETELGNSKAHVLKLLQNIYVQKQAGFNINRFNQLFKENKVKEEDEEGGYSDWMEKSDANRPTLDVPKSKNIKSENFNINILESSFLKDKFKSFKSVKLQKEVASSFIIKCTKNRLLISLRNLYYKELEITFTIQRKRKILIRNLTKESTDFSICSPLKKSASNLLIRDDLPSTNKETLIPISSRIYGTIATDYTTNATSMQNEGQTVNKSKEKLKAF